MILLFPPFWRCGAAGCYAAPEFHAGSARLSHSVCSEIPQILRAIAVRAGHFCPDPEKAHPVCCEIGRNQRAPAKYIQGTALTVLPDLAGLHGLSIRAESTMLASGTTFSDFPPDLFVKRPSPALLHRSASHSVPRCIAWRFLVADSVPRRACKSTTPLLRRSAPCQRRPTPRRPVQPGNARQKIPGGGCRSRHILVLTENAARTAAADQGCAASLPMTTRFSKI